MPHQRISQSHHEEFEKSHVMSYGNRKITRNNHKLRKIAFVVFFEGRGVRGWIRLGELV